MISEVLMPKLGQTMGEATVEKWHKKEGDVIERGEVILEITTDKATLEVESYVSGILRKIIAPEGTTFPVNAVIALVGEAQDALPANLDELISAAKQGKATMKKEAEVEAGAATIQRSTAGVLPEGFSLKLQPEGKTFASPRARMKARELKVSLTLLRGSGPGGRIVEEDVLAYAKRREAVPVTPTAIEIAYQRGVDVTMLRPKVGAHRITKEDVLAAPVASAPPTQAAAKPLSAMRRVVAERMSLSKREVPHFYLSMDVDMTEAIALREKLNAGKGKGIGFHDFILKACGMAMGEVPAMLGEWSKNSIVERNSVDIGIAVSLDEGLIVPVVRKADKRSLAQISAESRRLIEKARTKRLTPDEYEGGCFTISNLGMAGVDRFAAIINPGESGILGVGRIAKKPVVVKDQVAIRSMMNLTLSADHRVVDGATAAKFLARVRELLESPASLAV